MLPFLDKNSLITYQGKDTKQGTIGEGLENEWNQHQSSHQLLLQLPNKNLPEIDRVEQIWSEGEQWLLSKRELNFPLPEIELL